jgi:hypothetical protein
VNKRSNDSDRLRSLLEDPETLAAVFGPSFTAEITQLREENEQLLHRQDIEVRRSGPRTSNSSVWYVTSRVAWRSESPNGTGWSPRSRRLREIWRSWRRLSVGEHEREDEGESDVDTDGGVGEVRSRLGDGVSVAWSWRSRRAAWSVRTFQAFSTVGSGRAVTQSAKWLPAGHDRDSVDDPGGFWWFGSTQRTTTGTTGSSGEHRRSSRA